MEENQLKLLEASKLYLNSTRRWMKFFGVFMVISIVCLVAMAIAFMAGSNSLVNAFSGNLPGVKGAGAVMGIVYLILAGIMVFPTIYIFRAAKAAKNAIESNDNAQMTEFLKNTKSYWKFMGIYTIIVLAFVVFIMLIAMITAIAIG